MLLVNKFESVRLIKRSKTIGKTVTSHEKTKVLVNYKPISLFILSETTLSADAYRTVQCQREWAVFGLLPLQKVLCPSIL